MELLVFDLRAPLAHFRRPDTTATQASYPFIPRTALRGLAAAVLGIDAFLEEAWTGVQLLSPVRARAQEMSMLGKGFLESGPSFNRPTSIELVVQPHYRIFYTGAYQEELQKHLRNRQSIYHTYLGSAFALTFPELVATVEAQPFQPDPDQNYEAITVIPTHAVASLALCEGRQYGRAGGLLYQYLGERRFRGTINMVYEVSGQPLGFRAAPGPYDPPVHFAQLPQGAVVSLW